MPFGRGLVGHSDGDVLSHAVIDAALGGAGLRDMGAHFPSSDVKLEGIDSRVLMDRTVTILQKKRWRVTYVDATILAEQPTLSPFIDQIIQSLATSLNMVAGSVNLKAKSTDGLGFIGRGEGITAMSIATLEPAE
mgnify:CR=1 FL=1